MSGHAAALPYAIGVESLSARVGPSELTQACAAVQQQVTRDLAPGWHVGATVAPFPAGATPPGYWRVTIEDDIGEPGALGYHDDEHRQPFARVAVTPEWTVTLSHEVVEMLVDPFGARLWVWHKPDGERVHVLIEACDPPEAIDYLIDGVPVSDFVLPAYYRHRKRFGPTPPLTHMNTPLAAVPGIGLGLKEGGYVSWLEDGHWAQASWFGGHPVVNKYGRIDTAGGARSPRSIMDDFARWAKAEAEAERRGDA